MNKDKKWKAIPCPSGEECWCRLIVTDDFDGDLYKDNDDDIIIGSGHLSKEEAEYFIELHNKEIRSNKIDRILI